MDGLDTAIPVGSLIGGRWRIGGFLGAGGFGEVLLAEDVSEVGLGSAAVKVLHPNTSPLERRAFLGEVKKIAALRHQNLVGYLDSGQLEVHGDIRPYVVTELCDLSLADHLAASGGVLSAGETLAVLGDLTAGLAELHRRGLIHRDIKPGNALFADGRWKLADFGLMRDLSASGAYHRGDLLMGTPRYMAPELFATSTATSASDVYAIGVVAHECLVGRGVHDGTGPALIHNIATRPPLVVPTIDRPLADLVRWCVDPAPARRPLSSDLHQWAQRTIGAGAPPPIAPMPPTPTGPSGGRNEVVQPAQGRSGTTFGVTPPGSSPRSPWLLGAAAGALVVALAGLALLVTQVGGGVTGSGGADDPFDGDAAASAVASEAPDGDGAPDETGPVDVGGSTAVGEDVVVGEDVEIGGLGAAPPVVESGQVADPLTHLQDAPCTTGPVEQVLVANRHDRAVDYRLTIHHHDAAGVRIDESFDTATAVPPGASAMLAMGSGEAGVTGCSVAALVATPTDPRLVDHLGAVEVEHCARASDFDADVTFLVANPLDVPASIEVSIVVARADGVIIDEWFSETVDLVAPGEQVRSEVNWTYFNLGAVGPDEPIGCVVSWVDLQPT